mgnify:FL=1
MKFKEKLLGKELAKAATPAALEQYKEDRLLNYIENVKNDDPATMKMIAEYDPNAVKYNSAIGQFQKGDKVGPLSDFKDDLKKDDDFNERFKQDKERAYQELKTPTLYKNIFPLGKKKKLSDLDLIFEVASPKEKMGMRSRYKDYDFTQRQFKEDIPAKPKSVPYKSSIGEYIKFKEDFAALKELEDINSNNITNAPIDRAKDSGLSEQFTKEKLLENQIIKSI